MTIPATAPLDNPDVGGAVPEDDTVDVEVEEIVLCPIPVVCIVDVIVLADVGNCMSG